MASGYTKATDDLMDRIMPAIGPTATMVYLRLKRHANREGKCYPSVSKLQAAMNLSRHTICDALALLEYVGLVTTDKGQGRQTIYWVQPTETVLEPVQKVHQFKNCTSAENALHQCKKCTGTSADSALELVQKVHSNHTHGTRPTEPDPLNQTHVVGGAGRATRLPKDWCLPSEWRAIALTIKPLLDVDEEAEKFRDYWLGKGRDAAKCDWLATWRNWVRNARAPTNGNGFGGRNGSGIAPGFASKAEEYAEEMRRLGIGDPE